MSDPFLGEILISGYNFAPRGYALCSGQILSIQQNTALFSLLGTTYGGNGQTTFALPDLRGRVPISQGQGPGLSSKTMGQTVGEANHTLTLSEMASHGHAAAAASSTNQLSPAGHYWAADVAGNLTFATGDGIPLSAQAVSTAGGSQAHANLQPYLVLNYCIALQGVYPSRN